MNFNAISNKKAFFPFSHFYSLFSGRAVGTKCDLIVDAIHNIELERFVHDFKKHMVFVLVPMIVLILELMVSNTYLGIIIATFPYLPPHIKRYLLLGAAITVIGFVI